MNNQGNMMPMMMNPGQGGMMQPMPNMMNMGTPGNNPNNPIGAPGNNPNNPIGAPRPMMGSTPNNPIGAPGNNPNNPIGMPASGSQQQMMANPMMQPMPQNMQG